MTPSEKMILLFYEPGTSVNAVDDHLEIHRSNHDESFKIPASAIAGIILSQMTACSSGTFFFALKNKISVSLCDLANQSFASIVPADSSLLRRRKQFRAIDSDSISFSIANKIISSKINAQYNLLNLYSANYPEIHSLKSALKKLKSIRNDLKNTSAIPSLRGLEGIAASIYYSEFFNLFHHFSPEKRSKHPPEDPVNSMLSFGYSVLAHEFTALLNNFGFDSFAGFVHAPSSRFPALAADLMEPFRISSVDRTVLAGFNRKRYSFNDFSSDQPRINPALKKKFLADLYNAFEPDSHIQFSRNLFSNHIRFILEPFF